MIGLENGLERKEMIYVSYDGFVRKKYKICAIKKVLKCTFFI